MATRRASNLTIGYSPTWKQQSGWDVPLVNADVTRAFPATSRNYVEVEETTEDVDDCTGEDFLFEILTGQFARLQIDFDVDPDILAGIAAGAYGSPVAPSGGTNEEQEETITATGGTRKLGIRVGANQQWTPPLAYNANAAAVQAALEALSNVVPTDVVVTQAPGPPIVNTYAFGNLLGLQDVNMLDVNTFGLTGGTAVVAETIPGVGQLHAISRITGYTLPLLTFYIGYRNSDKQPVIFKNVVVDTFRVRAASREKVTCTVTLIGSADMDFATGYTMPACTDIVPIRFGDCKMSIDGTDFIAANLGREFEYYYENGVTPKFDGAGVDSTRHERADKRPSGMNMWVLGEPGDSIFNLGKAKVTAEAIIQCGPDGRCVRFTAPQGLVKLAPQAIRHGGDPPESEVALVVRPKKVSGLSTTPTNVTAITSQGVTYLIPA
jgi:hypothetical protein